MKLIRQMCTWSGAFRKKTFRENNRNTINKDENIIIGCYSHMQIIFNCQMSKQRLINRNKSNLYALLSSNDEDKRV
jgi:hypothetical protein